MGPTLNTAAAMNAYVLTDRGTWLAFRNRDDLGIARRGRPAAVQPVRRHGREPGEASAREGGPRPSFVEWWSRPPGQAAIAGYRINGEQLFFPNYKRSGA